MGRLTVSTEFRAPVARVWSLFADPARWTEWNGEWSEIRDVRGPFDHTGSGYTQVLRMFGREWLGKWEVTGCEPGVWRTVAGTLPFGVPFRGDERFEEIDGRTRVRIDVEWTTPWGWLGRALEFVMLPLMRRQFAANARRAAAVVEQA